MSLQTGGSGALEQSTSAWWDHVGGTSQTFAAWVYVAGDGDILGLGDPAGEDLWAAIFRDNAGSGANVQAYVGTNFFGSNTGAVAIGPTSTWFHVALVYTFGTSTLTVYARAEADTSYTLVASLVVLGWGFRASALCNANEAALATSGGRVSMLRLWLAALNTTEIYAESNSAAAVRTTDLFADTSCAVGSTIGEDTSGNNNDWATVGSGLALNAAEPTFASSSGPGNPTLTPLDDATGVSLTPTLSAVFGENIAAVSGNVTIKATVGDTTIETIDITDGGKVSISGATLTVTPSTPLSYGTQYYVLVDAGAIESTVDSEDWPGISSTTTWSFTTLSAITHIASAAQSALNATTTSTTVIPACNVDDILIFPVVNRDATAAPTVTDNDTGGNSWARVESGNDGLTCWWKRATSGTGGKSISVSGVTGSTAASVSVFRGCLAAGTPFENAAKESNASGNESHAAITPTANDSHIVLVVANRTNDTLDPTTFTATNPATLAERVEVRNTGGSDCSVTVASASQNGTAGSTGALNWAQANAASISCAFNLLPASTGSTGSGGTSSAAQTAAAAGTATSTGFGAAASAAQSSSATGAATAAGSGGSAAAAQATAATGASVATGSGGTSAAAQATAGAGSGIVSTGSGGSSTPAQGTAATGKATATGAAATTSPAQATSGAGATEAAGSGGSAAEAQETGAAGATTAAGSGGTSAAVQSVSATGADGDTSTGSGGSSTPAQGTAATGAAPSAGFGSSSSPAQSVSATGAAGAAGSGGSSTPAQGTAATGGIVATGSGGSSSPAQLTAGTGSGLGVATGSGGSAAVAQATEATGASVASGSGGSSALAPTAAATGGSVATGSGGSSALAPTAAATGAAAAVGAGGSIAAAQRTNGSEAATVDSGGGQGMFARRRLPPREV